MSDAPRSVRVAAERANRLDVFAFFVAFAVGLIFYFTLSAVGAHQVVLTSVMVLVMIGYALSVGLVPRLRLRLDQAGDNAYYLGLLFTLISMAVALYSFSNAVEGSGSGSKQIIGNFGIALATTITGIFLRIVLNQMRIDPADVEMMTRIELSEAAKRVRATLESVSTEMGLFLDITRQRTSDQLARIVESASKSLAEFSIQAADEAKRLTTVTADAHRDAVQKLSTAASGFKTIADEAQGAAERLRAVEAPPLLLARRLQAVAAALETVTAEAERVAVQLKSAGEASHEVSGALGSVSTRLTDASDEIARKHDEVFKGIDESASRLKAVLDRVNETIETTRTQMVALDAAAASSAQSAEASQRSAQTVLDNLVAVTEGLTDFVGRKD